MSTLQLPTGDNLLMAAFRAIAEGQITDPTQLVAAYEQHFRSTVAVPPERPPVFERFSLVDPSIRMCVQSSTASA
jgi:hypothetical protein